jgi:hypothetical protein
MGETAATEAKRRWNAEGAGMPPYPLNSCSLIANIGIDDIEDKKCREVMLLKIGDFLLY